jgi:hypothetical protein
MAETKCRRSESALNINITGAQYFKHFEREKNIAKYIILLTHLKSFFHPNNSPKRNVIIELEKNLTARNTGFQHR